MIDSPEMRPVCRFYQSSECKNPNCRFSHPIEYPVYIYAGLENDIHPDELRANVVGDPDMAVQADRIWIENYQQFCRSAVGDVSVDIVGNPDYFCMPFNIDAVSREIEVLKREGKLAPRQEGREDRYGRGSDGNRGLDNRGHGSRGHGDRGYDGRAGRHGSAFDGSRYGGSRFDSKGGGRYFSRYDGNRGDGRAGGKLGGDRPYGAWGRAGGSAGECQGGTQADNRRGGWFGGRDSRQNMGTGVGSNAGMSTNASAMGVNGFERAGRAAQPEEQGNSPEYEYQNIPYHYK